MKKLLFAGSIAVAVSFISSCSSEKTTVLEPQSFVFTTTSNWQQQGSTNSVDVQMVFERISPEITESIVNNGAVLAYVRVFDNLPVYTEADGNNWASLPYISTHSSYFYFLNFQYTTGVFRVTRKDSDLLPGNGNFVIKVVLLNPVQKNLLHQSNTNPADYNQVMELFESSEK